MNGYDDLKQLQKLLRMQGTKRTLPNLLAMAPQNDPFYAGSPAQTLNAQWFAELWSQWNTGTSHIRRIHYRVISQDEPVLQPNGKPYENTENCWTYLCDTSKHARILGLVDPDEFNDNRNDPTVVNLRREFFNPDPDVSMIEESGHLSLPHVALSLSAHLSLPSFRPTGYYYDHAAQPYYLLLIVEKTTMDDVLRPICRRYGVNYLAGAGFTSITRVRDELKRMQDFGKPARVFYISDFDPAGDAMPRAVSRQTEYWLKDFDVEGIKIKHLGLTRQQCIDYALPRTPIKDSDRRKASWESRQGDGATELDALEALYPGELGRIVTEAVLQYRDTDLPDKLEQADIEAQESIDHAWQELSQDLQTELASIEAEANEILEPLRSQAKELNRKLAPLRQRLEVVSQDIEIRSQQLTDFLPPRPEPETQPQDESEWLFDSDRDYLDQLDHYNAHRGMS